MLRTERLARFDGLRESDRIEIAHDGLKAAVLTTLAPPILVKLHQRLANAMVEAQSQDYEAIAEQWVGADEPERARAAAIMAADRAAHALAFDRASRLYCMALDLRGGHTPERQLRGRLAEALANSGHGLKAAAAFLAVARGSSAAEAIEYRRRAAEQYFQYGHMDEGLTVLREALEFDDEVLLEGEALPSGLSVTIASFVGWMMLIRPT